MALFKIEFKFYGCDKIGYDLIEADDYNAAEDLFYEETNGRMLMVTDITEIKDEL